VGGDGTAGGGGEGGGGGGALKAKLTCGKISMEVNNTHLNKLRALHRRYGGAATGDKGERQGLTLVHLLGQHKRFL